MTRLRVSIAKFGLEPGCTVGMGGGVPSYGSAWRGLRVPGGAYRGRLSPPQQVREEIITGN